MNRTVLPNPPDPNSVAYSGNPDRWATALFQWAKEMKSRIETDSAVNVRPVSPFVVSTYTAINTMTGTDNLSNFLATFITALQVKGLSSTRNVT